MDEPRFLLDSRSLACLRIFLLLGIFLCAPAPNLAQNRSAPDSERERAFQLFDSGDHLKALPILLKLSEAYPDDGPVLQRLGFALITQAQTLSDNEARKQIRKKGRAALLHAIEVGYNTETLGALVEKIPNDGEYSAFSSREEVEAVMQQAETAFAKRDLDVALKAYQSALQLDPKLYEAAVFIGDVYFMKKQWDKATEAYGKAVAIDPDRETAYRYWSDAYLRQGKLEEALDKALDAIIAEPYNRSAWVGLIQWAQTKGVNLGHPVIQPPEFVHSNDIKLDTTIDKKTVQNREGEGSWLYYTITRFAWTDERFAKEFPQEKTYRHTLREETEALRAVAEGAAKELKEGRVKVLDKPLAYLVQLSNDGLLESFILLAQPDEGLALDYPKYRSFNREKLRRYLKEYVLNSK